MLSKQNIEKVIYLQIWYFRNLSLVVLYFLDIILYKYYLVFYFLLLLIYFAIQYLKYFLISFGKTIPNNDVVCSHSAEFSPIYKRSFVYSLLFLLTFDTLQVGFSHSTFLVNSLCYFVYRHILLEFVEAYYRLYNSITNLVYLI